MQQQDQDIMKQNQDRKMKPLQGGENPNQQHQPQKCPRCESLNTKFCYYNNYSLSQPRYFCKTCRRYWTQGGTLRSVPVGGGCRKGKRVKTSSSSSTTTTTASSSSSEHSRSQSLVTSTQNMILPTTNSGNSNTVNVDLRAKESGNLVSAAPGISSMGSYNYSAAASGAAGFFMNSLAAIQSLNNQPPQSFTLNHQAMNLGGDFGGATSNLSLLQGFSAVVPSYGTQQQRQIYHMGSRDNKSTGDNPFYATTATTHNHQLQQSWHQAGFISSDTNPTTISDTALWSVSTSTTTGNSNNINTTANVGSFPLNPTDQWNHDLPGYGPPP